MPVTLLPGIRILCLLIFAVGLAYSGGAMLALALAGLFVLTWAVRRQTGHPSWNDFTRVVRRLRWLLLAMLLVYGWMTPGVPLIEALAGFSPSREGLAAGVERAVILLAIALAVQLLLVTTPQDDLLMGLDWLTRPLRWLGLDLQRFNTRLVLTLATVPRVQLLLSEWRASLPPLNRWRDFPAHLPGLWEAVVEQADAEPLEPVSLPGHPRVGPDQWLLPMLIFMLFGIPAMTGALV